MKLRYAHSFPEDSWAGSVGILLGDAISRLAKGVDARPSCPQRRFSPKVGGDSTTDLDGEDEDERTPYVHEKLWGKRPAGEEPSLKRRKIAASSHHEPLACSNNLKDDRW